MISIGEKKEFIKFIVSNYQFKVKKSLWILNYILSNDTILENLSFVRNVRHYPKGLLISTTCGDNAPFRFYSKDGAIITNVENTFHNIRLFPNEKLYIQLSFENVETDTQYNAIVEDDEKYDKELKRQNRNIYDEMDNFLNQINEKVKISNLYKQIDVALDNRDKNLFYELTNKLNELLAK